MKKTFGNGKVKTVNVARGESIRHDIPSKTGSKLGVRKVLPFEKRDDRPTSIGRIKGVRDVSKVSKVRGVHESDEELELIDVETCEGCSEKDELLDLVLTTFEQIYDNLSDDDKETVDEVKAEIESVLNPEDEDDEDEEIDGDFDDDEDIGESVVNEAGPKKVAPRRKAAPKKTATKVEIPKPTRSASATRRSSAELRKEIEARRAVERGTEPAKPLRLLSNRLKLLRKNLLKLQSQQKKDHLPRNRQKLQKLVRKSYPRHLRQRRKNRQKLRRRSTRNQLMVVKRKQLPK